MDVTAGDGVAPLPVTLCTRASSGVPPRGLSRAPRLPCVWLLPLVAGGDEGAVASVRNGVASAADPSVAALLPAMAAAIN